MKKIKYKCKNCGWERQIPGEWQDVKPRHCGNDKCELSKKKGKFKTSFVNNPDQLEKEIIEWIIPTIKTTKKRARKRS